MRYPVDVDIIHDGCRKVTDYIIKVCEKFELHKPRTNYKHARQAYLQLVKKAKKKGRMVRETIGVMLNYLHKDIRILMDLLAKNKDSCLCRPHTEHLSATRPCHRTWKGQGKD